MIELRGRLRFGEEPADLFGAGQLSRSHELDRCQTPQLQVSGFEDNSHPTPGNFAEDLVVANTTQLWPGTCRNLLVRDRADQRRAICAGFLRRIHHCRRAGNQPVGCVCWNARGISVPATGVLQAVQKRVVGRQLGESADIRLQRELLSPALRRSSTSTCTSSASNAGRMRVVLAFDERLLATKPGGFETGSTAFPTRCVARSSVVRIGHRHSPCIARSALMIFNGGSSIWLIHPPLSITAPRLERTHFPLLIRHQASAQAGAGPGDDEPIACATLLATHSELR